MDDLEEVIDEKLHHALGVPGLYIRRLRRIVLDGLWSTPDRAEQSIIRLEQFLDGQACLEQASAIVASDKVKVPFSIIPLVCALAIRRQKQLLVWKENAEILHGTSQLFGSTSTLASNGPIVVCHDVFVYGYALAKILSDLCGHASRQIGSRLRIASLVRLSDESGLQQLVGLVRDQTGMSLRREQFSFLVDIAQEWRELQAQVASTQAVRRTTRARS